MSIKQLLIATILLFFSAAYVQADFEETKLLAEQGEAHAQYNLGVMYDYGEGVPENNAEAIKWYRLAAEQGNANAQSHLFEETKVLAEKGEAFAQYNLGVMYENGKGVPENDADAVKWYRLAAEQGRARAQNNLGVMYENGEGVHENDVEAIKWFRLAAEKYNASAQFNLGNMYDYGEGVPENNAEAVKWYRLAAEQGNANAQSHLGVMYFNGDGVQQNDIKAYVWWSVAAAQERKDAKNNRDIVLERLTANQRVKGREIAAKCFESGYQDCE